MLNNITFEYPFFGLLFGLFLICMVYCKEKKTTMVFSNVKLLDKINKKNNKFLNILKISIAFFVVLALMSPIKKDDVIVQNDKGYEISLILDASGSMQNNNKFEIVKSILKEFIKKRKHDKIGLSIFADFSYVAIPLTYDKKSILSLLDKMHVGIAGERRTALNEALFASSKLFKDSKAKNKIAILLTDGENNVNNVPLDIAIKRAKKYGVKVYTIGIGRANIDFDSSVLHKIASDTGGKFFAVNSYDKLKEVYKEIDNQEKTKIKGNKYVKKTYYYLLPLIIAFLLTNLLIYLVYLKNFKLYLKGKDNV